MFVLSYSGSNLGYGIDKWGEVMGSVVFILLTGERINIYIAGYGL